MSKKEKNVNGVAFETAAMTNKAEFVASPCTEYKIVQVGLIWAIAFNGVKVDKDGEFSEQPQLYTSLNRAETALNYLNKHGKKINAMSSIR